MLQYYVYTSVNFVFTSLKVTVKNIFVTHLSQIIRKQAQYDVMKR